MKILRDEAIVLKVHPYRDTDLIVSLFTKHEGKLSAMALGAKKSQRRFGMALEIGSCLAIQYEERAGRELVFLKEALRLGGLQPWRTSWEGIAAASFVLELAARLLPERQASGAKFELLTRLLEGIAEENAADLLLTFQRYWLSLSGWEPHFDRCGICGMELDADAQWTARQGVFDHYWAHILPKPLVSRPLLEGLFV